MTTKKTHTVTFYSPGTFYDEQSTKDIDSWDTKKAVQMSKEIEERYNARPYAFRFKTWIDHDPVPDGQGGVLDVKSKEIESSGMYHLGGRLRTLDDVEKDNDPQESILRSNMKGHSPIVIENRNSYRHTGVYSETCVIVDDYGIVIDRGDSPKWKEYRKSKELVEDANSTKRQ